MIVIIIICIVLSALFSSSETAFASVNKIRLKSMADQGDKRALKALREFLRPEFIGRIDEIIVFNKLTKDDYAKIAGLMLNEMKEPLLEKQITLNVTEDACKLIAEKAYGKTYGAREIRRVIRQEVEDQIAECIIHNANTLRALTITAKDGKLVVQDEEVTA